MSTSRPPSPALLKYVHAVCRRYLSEGYEHIEIKEHGATVVSYFKGRPLAAYWFEGDQIVFRFRRPNVDDVRKEHAKHYIELKAPEGWLEYRRPLSRDPRPSLQAAAGPVVGTARSEVTSGKILLDDLDLDTLLTPHDGPAPGVTLASISSEGAPYIVLPRAKVAKYPGAADSALYETLCGLARERGNLTKTPVGLALLLAIPDNLYWFPSADGGLLVTVLAHDAADDEQLARDIESLPDQDWQPIEGELKATGPWCAFDAALQGPGDAEVLTLKLARGTYQLASRSAQGDGFEFMIVRFKRA